LNIAHPAIHSTEYNPEGLFLAVGVESIIFGVDVSDASLEIDRQLDMSSHLTLFY
jgi:hypothetical protein